MATDTPVSELQEPKTFSSGKPASARLPGSKEEIPLLDLLIVLAERKRVILAVTAGFAIVSIVISLLLPKLYTATVTLMPPQQNSSLSAQLASQLGSLGGMAASLTGNSSLLKNPNDMYVAMFKSRTVEDAMVERFGLMQEYHAKFLSDARKKFEHYADVDGSGKDGLIHISVEDHDPQRAAELANGYLDAFHDLSKNLAITEAAQRGKFFEQQMEDSKNNLASAEEALAATQQKTGLLQLDAQTRALIESAAALRAQITAKEVQIQGMQTYATGENAQLVEAEQELASLRAQLSKLGGASDNGDSIIVPKGEMTTAGLEYVRRLRDVKYYETIFDILARQFELAKLDEAKEGAIIQVVDHAVPPDKRSFPKRALIVIGATIVGFFIAILCALFQSALQNLKRNPDTESKLSLLRKALSARTRA
jgi:tyrosine-protein kinase Etk/Wzc